MNKVEKDKYWIECIQRCRVSSLSAGVDIVTIKNILGHISLQTTQIYAEMSQDMVDQKLREWNETWFGEQKVIKSKKADDIPDFLKRK